MQMTEFDPLEKLAILSPHAVDLRHIPSDFQRMTPADVAAKLSKASRGASLLGRVKVAGQGELVPDLIRELRTVVIQMHIPWPTNKMTLLPKLSQTALLEVVDPKVCRTCKGVGHLPVEAKQVTCEDCNGGRYAWTDYARARSCGLHHQDWKRRWNRVYLQILTIPWTWEGEVREALK